MPTQIQLVFALTAVHNFMNLRDHDPEAESNDLEYQESEDDQPSTIAADEAMDDVTTGMTSRRDEIAQMMWEDYQAYISGYENVS